MKDPTPPPRYVTAQEAADLLSVNTRTVYRWAVHGRLRAHQLAGGQRLRFLASDVAALVQSRQAEAEAES